MKIVELVYPNPPQVFIQRHIKALHDAGCDTQVVSMNRANSSTDSAASIQQLDADIDVIQGPIFTRMSILDKLYAARFLLQPHTRINGIPEHKIFSAFIERLRPDLIHFHTANLAAVYYQVPMQLGIPYTTSLRGTDVQVKPLINPEYQNRLTQALENAAGVHGVSDAIITTTIKDLNMNNEERYFKTIYTTIPIEPLADYPDNNKKTFVSIGRFNWRKAFVSLLIAFRKYLDQQQNAQLILIGDGDDEAQLLYWIKMLNLEDKVIFKGKLEYTEISMVLRQASAYIQSSIAEGFSNAVAEAMALGCPVFATNVGGTGEVIQDGENGFLLDFSTPETWWEKMINVDDFASMKQLRTKAWSRATELFSAQHHAEQFIDFYSESYHRYEKSKYMTPT